MSDAFLFTDKEGGEKKGNMRAQVGRWFLNDAAFILAWRRLCVYLYNTFFPRWIEQWRAQLVEYTQSIICIHANPLSYYYYYYYTFLYSLNQRWALENIMKFFPNALRSKSFEYQHPLHPPNSKPVHPLSIINQQSSYFLLSIFKTPLTTGSVYVIKVRKGYAVGKTTSTLYQGAKWFVDQQTIECWL